MVQRTQVRQFILPNECESSYLTNSLPGLAWIQQKPDENNPSLDSVNLYQTWPEKASQKVPSAISYSNTERGRRQWGHSIDDGSQVMRWTKLDIDSRTTVRELEVLRELMKGLELVKKLHANGNTANTNEVPRHITKDSGDVVRDYLTKVAREWYQYMRSQGRYTLDRVPLDIVITPPAVCYLFPVCLKAQILTYSLSPGHTSQLIKLSDPSLAHSQGACFQPSEISLTRRSPKHVRCIPFKI